MSIDSYCFVEYEVFIGNKRVEGDSKEVTDIVKKSLLPFIGFHPQTEIIIDALDPYKVAMLVTYCKSLSKARPDNSEIGVKYIMNGQKSGREIRVIMCSISEKEYKNTKNSLISKAAFTVYS
jgi:hypothetical protein